MTAPTTKWRGWVTIHIGDNKPVARSPDYLFELPGTDAETQVAAKELFRRWSDDRGPLKTHELDLAQAELRAYPNVVPVKKDVPDFHAAVDAWASLKGKNAVEIPPGTEHQVRLWERAGQGLEALHLAHDLVGAAKLEPGAVLSLAVHVLGLEQRKAELVVPEDMYMTRPPRRTVTGLVKCDGCNAEVPYTSMMISSSGYFCAGCAALDY